MKAIIVEDELVVARHLATILTKIGYVIPATAMSVDEALAEIDTHDPDLVLIDIMLRGERDGIALAVQIRQEYDIPFLFVTSHADRATIERAKATLPDGYILKPFTKDEVYAATEMALVRYAEARGQQEAVEDDDREPANASSAQQEGLPPYRLRKVKRFIDRHLHEELTLAQLAEAADMSKYYFSRLFKQSVGIPPYRYVLKRRIDRAKKLLRETDHTIARIALETGFSNQSHFGKMFRKQIGYSPSDFRERQEHE